MSRRIQTDRLVLRPWTPADARAALAIFGAAEVVDWLTPPVAPVGTEDAMRQALRGWRQQRDDDPTLFGHWTAVTRDGGTVVGGLSLQPAAPDDPDPTMSCALDPRAWGRGYAAEAATALLRWAVHEAGATEVFAIVRCDNARALATAKRIGMEWVEDVDRPGWGRTRVFRLRHGDLGTEG
jgi:RimJ/RimL family protein N-acetyltransferase